jgi:hypothetical protein
VLRKIVQAVSRTGMYIPAMKGWRVTALAAALLGAFCHAIALDDAFEPLKRTGGPRRKHRPEIAGAAGVVVGARSVLPAAGVAGPSLQ